MRRQVGLFLLTGALAALAVPSAAGPAEPARLTGIVTISGSATGYVPVVVAKDAVLPGGLGPEARNAQRVTGGGKFAGFALVQDGLDGAVIIGGHSRASAADALERGEFTGNFGPDQTGSDFAVPAGSYRLYLITDGQPTTVTLRFAGLAGESGLVPTVPTRAVVQTVPLASAGPAPAGAVYSGGGEATVTTPFVNFYVNKLATQVHTESVFRSCFYLEAPTGPMPYGPGCASVDADGASFGDGAVFPISSESVTPSTFYNFGGVFARIVVDGADQITRPFGAGASVTTVSAVAETDYTQAWLQLDAAPGKPAAPRPAASDPATSGPGPGRGPTGAGPAAPSAPQTAGNEMLPVTGPDNLAVPAVALMAAATLLRRRRTRLWQQPGRSRG